VGLGNSLGRKELHDWVGGELEVKDVASEWQKELRLHRCSASGCVDSSLAMLRGQITAGSPNVTVQWQKGGLNSVISDLDDLSVRPRLLLMTSSTAGLACFTFHTSFLLNILQKSLVPAVFGENQRLPGSNLWGIFIILKRKDKLYQRSGT
jgi:hypothetical protein